MKYSVVIEWSRYDRRYEWEVTDLSCKVPLCYRGLERRLSKAKSRVAEVLQQLKAEHEEDLRNAGKRIEFEGEL